MNMKKAAGVAALALAGYDALVRPRMLGWGASRGEQHMQPPGDEIASGVPAHYTRAVIIEAPPEAVWPWLAQIGDHRAGFYSYDWVERFIFPGTVHYIEGTHSATRIHPELQEVHIGDRIDTAATFGDGLTAWWAVRYDCRWLEAGDRAWTLRPSRNAVGGRDRATAAVIGTSIDLYARRPPLCGERGRRYDGGVGMDDCGPVGNRVPGERLRRGHRGVPDTDRGGPPACVRGG